MKINRAMRIILALVITLVSNGTATPSNVIGATTSSVIQKPLPDTGTGLVIIDDGSIGTKNPSILAIAPDLSTNVLNTALFQWPTRGTIGSWIFGSNNGKHYGVDIIHPQGTTLGDEVTVYPVYTGKVFDIWTDYGREINDKCAYRGGIKSVIVIYHPDINLYSMYFHMANESDNVSYIDSNIRIGQEVYTTTRLGKMGNRVYNPCTDGESTGAVFHHHFAITTCGTSGSCGINPNPYFPGYQLNINEPNRTPIGTYVSPGSGTSSCLAPSLTSPGIDYVSPGNEITFAWSHPNNCSGQNGFLVRVGTSPGGSNVISDRPISGLQGNIAFDTQWNDRDLYWSVRANATNTPWSGESRHFRIHTNQTGTCSSYVNNLSFNPASPSNATSVAINVSLATNFPSYRAARLKVVNGDGICEQSSFNFSCNWDTRNTSDGDQTILLEIDDNQGSAWDNPATCSKPYHLDPRPTPPPGPFNLSSPAYDESIPQSQSVTLSWESSSGATEYVAYLYNGSTVDRNSGYLSSRSWNVGVLSPGYYYWYVTARNQYGAQDSEQWTFFVQQGVPSTPSNLIATAVTQSQINLSWSDNSSNENGFRLYREGLLIRTLGAGETSFQNTSLSCGTGYNYYVVAF